MDFPSNSHYEKKGKKKPVAEKEPVEKVVEGPVIVRKKPLGRRFKELIFGEDFRGATRYIAADVLLPAVRNMVVDATTKGIERMVYGDNAPRTRSGSGRSKTTYNSPISRSRSVMIPDQPPFHSRHERGLEVRDIILSSRLEAERVVEELMDMVEEYQYATVADFYSLLGHPTTFVDNQWGWSALHYIEIRQIREGWLLDMPSPEPIRN
jgi:hypothetical protein